MSGAADFVCPKCGNRRFVQVVPVLAYSEGKRMPRAEQVGMLARCTRHACGRLWEVTNFGLAEPSPDCVPGRTVVRQLVAPRPPREDEGEEREPDVSGEPVPRARV
jgi:hypothetical protein